MNSESKKILVTGGAGFIGSALIRHLIQSTSYRVLNFDKLTYAGSLSSVKSASQDPRYQFVQADICDRKAVEETLKTFKPDLVMHLAAETHVDRSIDGPADFIQTNIVGTSNLLEQTTAYWKSMNAEAAKSFRFLHISTDEVFGSLGNEGFFQEESPYDPRSPYSASKASSDHLVRAWNHTYKFPGIITNCSNNYGPFQYPEKLIPVVILKAIRNLKIPVYGQGTNVRDWLFVDDHVKALLLAAEKGRVGETYLIGGHNERSNLELVQEICSILDEIHPHKNASKYAQQIEFVQDRPGHDQRYAIDPSKIERELHWKPQENLRAGLRKTLEWYLSNLEWVEAHGGEDSKRRLGLAEKRA